MPISGAALRRLLSKGRSVLADVPLPWRGSVRLQGAVAAAAARVARAASAGAALAALDESMAPLFDSLLRNRILPLPAKALTVKILNLLLAQYHLEARDTRLLSSPYGIVVDPTNNCQLACPGCVHSAHSRKQRLFDWPPGMLSEPVFAGFMRQYGPCAIETAFYNCGEPLLNPNTPRFIRIAKTYLARTSLSTNMAVKHFDPEAYVTSGLDFMTVSIDGATQATYERFRRNGDLETVFKNVRSLIRARRRLNKGTPIVSWQFLAFEHNRHEIDAAVAAARELQVDQFVLAQPFDVGWDDPEIRPAPLPPRVEQFHSDSGRRMAGNWNPFPSEIDAEPIGRQFSAPWRDRSAGLPDPQIAVSPPHLGHTCRYLYGNIAMDAGGRILPCAGAPAWDANLVFASGGSQTDHFNSEQFRRARLWFANPELYGMERKSCEPELSPHCEVCDRYENQRRAHVDRDELRDYFTTVGPGVFNRASKAILSA